MVFSYSTNPIDVYCYAKDVPDTYADAFQDRNLNNSTLYVPSVSIEKYSNALPWKNFGVIHGIEDTGIKAINLDYKESVYIVNGSLCKSKHKGINVIKMSNGKTKKIIIK